MWLAVAGVVRHMQHTWSDSSPGGSCVLFFNGLLGLIVLSTCHSVVVNIAGWNFFFLFLTRPSV